MTATEPRVGKLSWQQAALVSAHPETTTARTLTLTAPNWAGHLAGQHVDLRLTGADGYSAQRSYSIASASKHGEVEITVQRVIDGEVSTYLVDDMVSGDQLDLRGPIGRWFAWDPHDARAVVLIAGGSGVVPLMAMIRERARIASRAPFRLIYSVRSPEEALYQTEIQRRCVEGTGLRADILYTRARPASASRPPGRLGLADLPGPAEHLVFVCGPTGFVEACSTLLLLAGHDPDLIRTERFGPSGA